MYTKVLLSALFCIPFCIAQTPDSAGYILPQQGNASTTQFNLSSEIPPQGSGTSCGVTAAPSGASVSSSGTAGGGSGLLYAAINQLAFGANPNVNGGAGGACGVCYKLTPVSAQNQPLPQNALTFMIIDECPADPAKAHSVHCTQCSLNDVNDFGHNFHFDIASDGMNQQQYTQFYNGVTDGQNWKTIQFEKAACQSGVNSLPQINPSFGCVQNCTNNDSAGVCQSVPKP